MDSEVEVACVVISITRRRKEKFSSGILQRSCGLWALSKLKHTGGPGDEGWDIICQVDGITIAKLFKSRFNCLHLPYIYIYRIINTNYGSLDFNIVSKYIRMIDCRTGCMLNKYIRRKTTEDTHKNTELEA
ncbi:hypothetical protein F8M41_006983 [Gigaspora margarita]|uniref:Uncharacterized protein n=1 Tax=Gigaspora margarita TaxID=4874 RepID=A0A8H3X6C7_GIGMA|nr:hypothetical protein F8M41_006983 [Gigaspora margarita]